ncbi:hypothetical protein C0991_008869 [Blastosporella zonata]|nr:hypothetical protein C0991_008869 [Blastosporella zonata]
MLLEVESYQFRPDFRSFPKENFVQEVFYGPSSRGPISQAEYEGIIKRGAASTVLGEVKRKDGVRERSDNEDKLISAATWSMYDDPRRRHLYGFTIEKSTCRLWNFNRSHNPDYLIQFLLFITCADATQLGYDPTVERVPHGVRYFYTFALKEEKYVAEGPPVSQTAAFAIISQATRVWKVRRWDGRMDRPGREQFILKDVWLNSDSLTEGEIQKAIFQNFRGEALRKARSHFLTVVQEWKVEWGPADHTFALPNRWKDISLTEAEQVLAAAQAPGSSRMESLRDKESDAAVPSKKKDALSHDPRMHVRTLFREICISLYEVTSYATYVKGLAHAVQGPPTFYFFNVAAH